MSWLYIFNHGEQEDFAKWYVEGEEKIYESTCSIDTALIWILDLLPMALVFIRNLSLITF